MSFYADMAAVVLQQIERFGTSIPIRRLSRIVDHVTGESTELIQHSGTIKALVLPASKGTIEAFDNREIGAGDMVEGRLRFLVVAAKSVPFEPRPRDLVVIESASWEVMGSTPLAPAGIPLLYRVGVKLA